MGNFGSELSKYLPLIGHNVGEGFAARKRAKRQQRISAAFMPPETAGYQEMTDPSGGAIFQPDTVGARGEKEPLLGGMTSADPEQMERQIIGEQIRDPKVMQDMIAEGWSPGDILQVYKSLPTNQRPDFQRMYEEQKYNYITNGPDTVLPQMRPYIEKELGVAEDVDLTRVADPRVAKYLLDQKKITPAQYESWQSTIAQPAPFAIDPSQIKDRKSLAIYRRLNPEFSEDMYKALDADLKKLEDEDKKPEEDKNAFTPEKAREFLVGKADRDLKFWSDPKRAETTITKAEYDRLPDAEKAKFVEGDQEGFYKGPNPEAKREIKKAMDFLGDYNLQKQAADSLYSSQAASQIPPEVASQAEAAIKEFEEAGFIVEEEERKDPQFILETYKAWVAAGRPKPIAESP